MSGTQSTMAIERIFTITPIAFEDDKETFKNLKYVKPLYICKEKLPIFKDKVNKMEQIVKNIDKIDSSFYRGARKVLKKVPKKSQNKSEKQGVTLKDSLKKQRKNFIEELKTMNDTYLFTSDQHAQFLKKSLREKLTSLLKTTPNESNWWDSTGKDLIPTLQNTSKQYSASLSQKTKLMKTNQETTNIQDTLKSIVSRIEQLQKGANPLAKPAQELMEYLNKYSFKARMMGLSTIYTKYYESLNEWVANVQNVLRIIETVKNQIIAIYNHTTNIFRESGTSNVTLGGAVIDFQNRILELNKNSQIIYQAVRSGKIYKTEKKFLDECKTLMEDADNLVANLTQDIDEIFSETKRSSREQMLKDTGGDYITLCEKKLSDCKIAILNLKSGIKNYKRTLKEMSATFVGKLYLAKSRHEDLLTTLKAAGSVVKNFSSLIK